MNSFKSMNIIVIKLNKHLYYPNTIFKNILRYLIMKNVLQMFPKKLLKQQKTPCYKGLCLINFEWWLQPGIFILETHSLN